MYGSADSLEHWAENTMTLRVDPDRMLVTARGFEAIANKIQRWLVDNQHGLVFEPMGGDEVSKVIAGWVHESAFGERGLVPALELAARNMRETGSSLREQAAAYGFSEDSNAGDIGSLGSGL